MNFGDLFHQIINGAGQGVQGLEHLIQPQHQAPQQHPQPQAHPQQQLQAHPAQAWVQHNGQPVQVQHMPSYQLGLLHGVQRVHPDVVNGQSTLNPQGSLDYFHGAQGIDPNDTDRMIYGAHLQNLAMQQPRVNPGELDLPYSGSSSPLQGGYHPFRF